MTFPNPLSKAFAVTLFLIFSLLPPLTCNTLKVHIIINSHLDMGWVNTIDEYFSGIGTHFGEEVQRIFTDVFDELSKNQNRTYTIAELGYLDLWWKSQSEKARNKALTLIKQGRVELLNGGWVTNDEACPVYDDIIENFIVGHRWNKDVLNHTDARIGWQMDSFGTSVTQAYLMKEAGYEGMFFSRVDESERERRKNEKAMEFNWEFPNSQESIFTHIMTQLYSKPVLERAKSIGEIFSQGSLNETDYQALNKTLWGYREYFKTDHILLLFCGDFYLSFKATSVYKAIDELIRYYQENSDYGLEVFYSNVGTFVKEVKQELQASEQTLSKKQGDFFPLNEQSGIIWSGFYTSKANFKGLVRWHSRYLTAAKLLISQRAMRRLDNSDSVNDSALYHALTEMEKALATMQHHDAVTGTMKEYVRFDYEDILRDARRNLEDKIREILLSDLKLDQPQEAIVESMNVTYDSLLGGLISPEMSDSVLSTDSELVLAVMNPGNTRLFLLTANLTSTPKSDKCIVIESSDGRIISPDIICQRDSADCSVYFTDNIEAYSWMYYQVKEIDISEENNSCGNLLTSEEATSATKITSSNWALQLDDGNLFTFIQNKDGKTVSKQFRFSYSYYESSVQKKEHHASGAYLFRPRSIEKESLSVENQTVYWVGEHVAIIKIQSANFTTTIQLLLEQGELGFSVITQLAPIYDAKNGCEIIMEIDVPEFQTDGKFFTDSNGYFMLERPYTPASVNETAQDEIAKNYHPMTTRCSLEGNNGAEAFTVFTDRTQGASIQKDNQINIMLHRVAVMDDDEGVDEVLNETYRNTSQPVAVTTWHYFLWSSLSTQAEREVAQYDYERPLHMSLFSVNSAFSVARIIQTPSTLSNLPKTLKINARTYGDNDHFIRLQNLDPKNNLSVLLSSPDGDQSPSLLTYLSQKRLARLGSILETLWTTTTPKENSTDFDINGSVKIELAPLQMRTFQISLTQAEDKPQLLSGSTDISPEITIDSSESIQSHFAWLQYYLYVHGGVAILYLSFCLYRAKKKNISILTFKREMFTVLCLGPMGIAILWYMQRHAKPTQQSQKLIDLPIQTHSAEVKAELLADREDNEF